MCFFVSLYLDHVAALAASLFSVSLEKTSKPLTVGARNQAEDKLDILLLCYHPISTRMFQASGQDSSFAWHECFKKELNSFLSLKGKFKNT